MSDEEKGHVRPRLLQLLDHECDDQIALQIAIAIAKVARIDYPKQWPTLFTELLARLPMSNHPTEDVQSTLIARRSFLVLHHVIKELSSKRLASDQEAFRQVSEQLTGPLWTQWESDTGRILKAHSQLPVSDASHSSSHHNGDLKSAESPDVYLAFERWHQALKALRRMLMFGFPSDAKTLEHVSAVFHAAPCIINYLDQFLSSCAVSSSKMSVSSTLALLEKSTVNLVKTLRHLQDAHPWTFLHCGALVSSLKILCKEVSCPRISSSVYRNAFLRHAFQLMSSSLECPSYKGSVSSLSIRAGRGRELSDKLKHLANEACPLIKDFWTHHNERMVELLISQYFLLTPYELELWEHSGEEFHAQFDHASKDSSVRACAEAAFLALVESDRARLGPFVALLLQRVCAPNAPSAFEDGASNMRSYDPGCRFYLIKAAVYHAALVGAYGLHEYVDFTFWLHSSLLQDTRTTAPLYRPVRRAAICLFKTWIPTIRKEDKDSIYETLITAISDPDLSISLAGVASLHALVDDWDFDEVEFAKFVSPTVESLSRLLQMTMELEAQLDIFSLLNVIIDRSSDEVSRHTRILLQLLPSAWHQSEGQSLLKIQILLAFQRLVHALGPESTITYHYLLPILDSSVSSQNPNESSIVEDGLLTWLVTLRHAPSFHPALLVPLPHLLGLLESSTEYLPVGARILTSCVMLAGGEVLSKHGTDIVRILLNFVGNVTDRGMALVLSVVDTIIAMYPQEGYILCCPLLISLLRIVHGGKQSGYVIVTALNIFGRLLLTNPQSFMEVMSRIEPDSVPLPLKTENMNSSGFRGSDDAQLLIVATLDVWLKHFGSINQAAGRKLAALSFLALLSFKIDGILKRMEAILGNVAAVWSELEAEGSSAGYFGADFLASSAVPRDDDLPMVVNVEEAEGESERRKRIFNASSIAKMKISQFARQQLELLSRTHGDAAIQNALSPPLLEQLNVMMKSSTV